MMTLLLALFVQDATIADDNNAFATELYAQLRKTDGNLFYSPYSISTALAMTYAGARGETAAEMARVLHYRLEGDKLHEAFAAQIKELNGGGKDRGYALSVANALWGQNGYALVPAFTELVKKHYDGGMTLVDFMGATEEARKTINSWVEKKTNDKIKELLKPGILTEDTRLVLTNAIYFKGDWAVKFDKKRTAKAPFALIDGTKADVDLMHMTADFRYASDASAQVLAMPYKGKELTMIVMLPKDLKAFEADLTSKVIDGWVKKLHEDEVHVWLPKFKMTSEFSLGETLSTMGMPTAFTPNADLTGMNPSGKLYIQAVVHKAFVEVNEEGTEAAAATAVAVGEESVREENLFRADRPFLFAIRHEKTGAILFMGRVADPR